MLQDFWTTLLLLSLRDRLFVAVVVATVALSLVSLVVALAIIVLHDRRDRGRRRWLATVSELEPVVLDVLAGDQPPESVWRRVRPADGVRFTEFLLQRFAHKLKGEELQATRELAAPYLDVVAGGASSSNPETRAQAIQSLATLGLSEYEGIVVQALGDPSHVVALVSARALAEAGGPSYVGAILDCVHRFELWSSSFLAVMLASMGPEAVPALAERYVDREASPEVRAICASALGQIGGPEVAHMAAKVLEELESVATTDPRHGARVLASQEVTAFGDEREVVLNSLKILRELGHSEQLALVRRLAGSPDPVVRALAIDAIGSLGNRSDIPDLVAAVGDASRWVAVHAATSLKKLGALEELERLTVSGTDRAQLAREVTHT